MRTPHARLLANISAGFSSGGGFTDGRSATPRVAPWSRSGMRIELPAGRVAGALRAGGGAAADARDEERAARLSGVFLVGPPGFEPGTNGL